MRQSLLEIVLYFFANCLLISIGVILIQFKVEGIGSSLVAGGIAGIATYWAIYVHRARSDRDEHLLECVKSLGIVEILSRRLVKEEGDALGNKARSAMDIMGFGLKTFYEDVRDGQLVKVASQAMVRILVVDPNSPHCDQGDYEEAKTPGSTREEVIRITQFIRQLAHPNVKLRWYSAIPGTHLLRADNEVLVGPYLVELAHRNTYSIRLGPGILFDYYQRHFETIWEDPRLSREPDWALLAGAGGRHS